MIDLTDNTVVSYQVEYAAIIKWVSEEGFNLYARKDSLV